MANVAHSRRVANEIRMLQRDRESLAARGIYFSVDEADMLRIDVLVVPRAKADIDVPGLESPYTGGFFLFEVRLGADYPMGPPLLTFHPQQPHCRLHPNYYENGKVCLSVVNTWGASDWTPALSVLALIDTLEARFNERPLCFEPGRENAPLESLKAYNRSVAYGVLKWAVAPVVRGGHARSSAYDSFAEAIRAEFERDSAAHLLRLDALEAAEAEAAGRPKQVFYSHPADPPDTAGLRAELQALQAKVAEPT